MEEKELLFRSRGLRQNMTKEENKLWYQFLRKYPIQFKHQYIIGSYIVDFYCYQARLIVELDGSQHYEQTEQAKDAARTAYLKSRGFQVVRYSNLDVTRSFRLVCEDIDRIARSRLETVNGSGLPSSVGKNGSEEPF